MKKKINISDKAFEVISNQKIKPIPKWEFVLKNWGLWLGFGLCLILLTLGISLSWFGIIDNIITPNFWIFMAFVFLVTSYYIFDKTKKAYRFEKWQRIVFILIIGVFVGGMLFKVGLASKVDRSLESRVGFYRQMVPMRMKVWSSPDQGYLSGKITKIIDRDNFQIIDFSGSVWTIIGRNTIIRGRVQMRIGEEIKLIGVQKGPSEFEVEEIRPWNGTMMQNMMKENY